MRKNHRGSWILIVPAIAFWVATIAYAWRLAELGVGTIVIIPAICFPIAAVLSTMRVIDWHRRKKN